MYGILLLQKKIKGESFTDTSLREEKLVGPSGLFLPPDFDQEDFDHLWETWLIIAILLVFLYEWRTALITVVAIPLSLMAAVLCGLYVANYVNGWITIDDINLFGQPPGSEERAAR